MINALALGLLLGAAPVDIELYKVPKGRPVTVEGVQYMAYTFPEWKDILSMDQDLKAAEIQIAKYSDIDKLLYKITLNHESLLDLSKSQTHLWQTEYENMFTKWEETNKKYHKAKAGGIFKHFPLLIGGTLTIINVLGLIIP